MHTRLYAPVSDIQTYSAPIIPPVGHQVRAHGASRSGAGALCDLRGGGGAVSGVHLVCTEEAWVWHWVRSACRGDPETNQKIMLILQAGWGRCQRYAIINSTPFLSMPSGEFSLFPGYCSVKEKNRHRKIPGWLKANCHKTLIFWLKRSRSFKDFWFSISCSLYIHIYAYIIFNLWLSSNILFFN